VLHSFIVGSTDCLREMPTAWPPAVAVPSSEPNAPLVTQATSSCNSHALYQSFNATLQMAGYQEQLLQALEGAGARSGSFAASGQLPSTLPGLHIEGAGLMGLPLNDAEAQAITGVARALGSECEAEVGEDGFWELDKSRFSMQNDGEPRLERCTFGHRRRQPCSSGAPLPPTGPHTLAAALPASCTLDLLRRVGWSCGRSSLASL